MSEYKVASLDVWTAKIQDEVRRCAPDNFAVTFANSYDPAEQTALMSDADLVLTGWAEITAAMMRAAPRVCMIQKWGIGVDRIDLDAARQEGLPVAITAGANASPVAEHTIMLMLTVFRRLPYVDRTMREGRWAFAEMREQCFQLRGKTVGLVGFGRIGQAVARKLSGFDLSMVYYDPVRASSDVEDRLAARFVPFDELTATSDIISLHCPGGPPNVGLFDAARLAACKPSAILINAARGDLVDEDALFDALNEGRLMGAGLDVYEPEPPVPDHRLATLPQVVLTPHTAGSVIDNVGHVTQHAFRNMQALLRGEALPPADLIVWPERRRAVSRGA